MVSVDYRFQTLNYFPFEGYGRFESLLKKYIEFNPVSDNVFLLGYPHEVKKPKGKLVYHSVFESTKLPEKWVEPANRADAIITTTKWCKDVFEDSGVKVPVYIVPEGTDEFEVYEPKNDIFTFLHYSFTSEKDRKGSKILLRAFLEVFGNIPKTKLIMKGNTHESDTLFWKSYPNVEYIYSNYDREKMLELVSKANCFVFPSKGEGFGLPAIENMAHGIPTIVSDNTAMSSYAQLAIPLPMRAKQLSQYTLWDNKGYWFIPNEVKLKELMWDVYKNYDTYKKKALENQLIVKKTYAFDKIAKDISETLNKILG